MENNLQTGLKHKETKLVQYEDTAANYGSGMVEVLATPAMIALMEKTAMNTVQPYLEEGHTTVGFRIDVRHLKPTPIGKEVRCTSRLGEVEGKKLVFEVSAEDDEGKIGEGTHVRYIINTRHFMQQITNK